MYWVIALFDKKTEQHIKNIWEYLAESRISYYLQEFKEARPHLTLAAYDELDKEDFIELMDQYYQGKHCIDVTFNTLGSFLNYPTLFLSPTMTNELSHFHSSHHSFFKPFNNKANSLYSPSKWIPHCTLANRISTDKLSEAFNFCLKRMKPIVGNLEEVALIERVSETDNCVDAPIIYTKRLTDRKNAK